MEIIPLMCALPLSISHSNKWVNWLWAIKKLNETNKMCVLIFLDGYFVWGLVTRRKSLSFCTESNCSTLINISVTSQTPSLSLILQCAFWHRPQIVIRWQHRWEINRFFRGAGYWIFMQVSLRARRSRPLSPQPALLGCAGISFPQYNGCVMHDTSRARLSHHVLYCLPPVTPKGSSTKIPQGHTALGKVPTTWSPNLTLRSESFPPLLCDLGPFI